MDRIFDPGSTLPGCSNVFRDATVLEDVDSGTDGRVIHGPDGEVRAWAVGAARLSGFADDLGLARLREPVFWRRLQSQAFLSAQTQGARFEPLVDPFRPGRHPGWRRAVVVAPSAHQRFRFPGDRAVRYQLHRPGNAL